jgi:hypothetical protein
MDRQISKYGFYVKNEVIGETKAVLVMPEYRELFDTDHSIQEEHKTACFFVRKRIDGKFVCTIHPSRLFICKDYHCCSARVSRNGEEVGRVKGKFSLVTKDETLRSIWLEGVQKQSKKSREEIISLLHDQEYSIMFYDGE